MLRSLRGRAAFSLIVSSLTFAVSTLAAPTNASADVAQHAVGAECHDVVMLGARGSGQAADLNGGFGPEVQYAADNLVSYLEEQGDQRDIGMQWVEYNANS